jgi:hypothetical protein
MPSSSAASSSSSRPVYDWNRVWQAHDKAAFASSVVACMFRRALMERIRAVYPTLLSTDFDGGFSGRGNTRGFTAKTMATVLLPDDEASAMRFAPIYAPTVCHGNYTTAGPGDGFWRGDRILLPDDFYNNRDGFLDVTSFTWGTLQYWCVLLAKAFYDPDRTDWSGYDEATYNADRAAYATYFWPDPGSGGVTNFFDSQYGETSSGQDYLVSGAYSQYSANPPASQTYLARYQPWSQRLMPAPLYNRLPKWPGPDGFTRKREREISRLDAPGQAGQIARFVVRGRGTYPNNYGVGYATESGPWYEQYSGLCQGVYSADPIGSGSSGNSLAARYPAGVIGMDPDFPFDGSASGRTYPVQCATPADQWWYSLLLCEHRDGQWQPINGSASQGSSGAVNGAATGSGARADIVVGHGVAMPGDIFGEWVLNETRDAINKLVVTCGRATRVDDYVAVFQNSSYSANSRDSSAPSVSFNSSFIDVQNCASGQQGLGLAKGADPDAGITAGPCFCNRQTTYYEVRATPPTSGDAGVVYTTLGRGGSPVDKTTYQPVCIKPFVPASGDLTYVANQFAMTRWDVAGGFEFTAERGDNTCDGSFPVDTCAQLGTPTSSSGSSGSSTSSSSASSDGSSFSSNGSSSGMDSSTASSGGSNGGGGPPGGTCDNLAGTWLYTYNGTLSAANTLTVSGTAPDYTYTYTGGPLAAGTGTLTDHGDGTVTAGGFGGTLASDCNKINYGGDYWCRGSSCVLPGGGGSDTGGGGSGGDSSTTGGGGSGGGSTSGGTGGSGDTGCNCAGCDLSGRWQDNGSGGALLTIAVVDGVCRFTFDSGATGTITCQDNGTDAVRYDDSGFIAYGTISTCDRIDYLAYGTNWSRVGAATPTCARGSCDLADTYEYTSGGSIVVGASVTIAVSTGACRYTITGGPRDGETGTLTFGAGTGSVTVTPAGETGVTATYICDGDVKEIDFGDDHWANGHLIEGGM